MSTHSDEVERRENSNHPSRYARTICMPLRSEFSRRPRLLKKDNPKVEPTNKESGIDDKSTRSPEHAPSHQNRNNADVHRISRNPIRPSGHQMLWWIPGCQSASPSQVEFAHAPQQKKYAQAKRHCCKRWVLHGEVCRDTNRDGQRKGDYARQSDKCGDGSDEHQTTKRGCVAEERLIIQATPTKRRVCLRNHALERAPLL